MRPVGYLLNGRSGLEEGSAYNYVLASNGIFIRSSNDFMAANICISECEVRGLGGLEPYTWLNKGKIPSVLFDLALNSFLADTEIERYMAITWEDGYHLWQPEQKVSASSIEYQTMDNVVLELHSHGKMGAFFSAQDNKDEQGFRIYAVAGRLNDEPRIRLRVGVYGYFREILFQEVFDGPCPIDNGVKDED